MRKLYVVQQHKRYGSLTPLAKLQLPTGTFWRCKCACGRETKVANSTLAKGTVKSCGNKGCKYHDHANLTGKPFGKLTALRFVKHCGRSAWLTVCVCGKKKPVRTENLVKGNTKSCGRKGCQEHGATKLVLPDNLAAKNAVYRNYANHAHVRGLLFGLKFRRFVELCESPCHYCGVQPSNTCKAKGGDWTYSGIDRKNSKVGYTSRNVVSCCKVCNRAKNNMGYNEFLTYLNQLVRFRKGGYKS